MPPFVALKMEVTATGLPTGFNEDKPSLQRRRISVAKVNQHLLKSNKSLVHVSGIHSNLGQSHYEIMKFIMRSFCYQPWSLRHVHA